MSGAHVTGPFVSKEGFKVGTKSTNTEVITSAGIVAAPTSITAGTSVTAGTYVTGSLVAKVTTAVYAITLSDSNLPAGAYELAISSTAAGSAKLFLMGSTASVSITLGTT